MPGGRRKKVNQIRIYSGAKFESVKEAPAGCICAVTGPIHTHPGQGIGSEPASELPMLEPVLTYRILLPFDSDVHKCLQQFKQLEEEEPELHVLWNEELGEIQVQLMGDVQIEILKHMLEERYGLLVGFDTGNIVYKETILNTVEGVGHFEPLRHYAEVHLLLEPGEAGSGLQFDTVCSEDVLERNWQRLILTHLEEKIHRGVLTGAEITDMKVTLLTGRAHMKHTEGGDFRQATYRALRQGLMQAESQLLEPYYGFTLELPSENLGRAMADMDRMFGTFEPPVTTEDGVLLTGKAPVACLRDYQREVIAYTKGRGHLSLWFKDYEPCHNAEEVIEAAGYDPEADLENTADSVFCSHGAGYLVPWYQVKEYMHVESPLEKLGRRANGENDTEGGMQGDMGRFATVSQGETLKRTGKGDSWSRVVYNGKEAYISNRYITAKAAGQGNSPAANQQSGETIQNSSSGNQASSETVAFNTSWKYAEFSKIFSGIATLYRSTAAARKNHVICVNAGHGTKGGSSVKTQCHPDGSAKVTGGTTGAGATSAVAVSSGMTFADGTPESQVTLAMAKKLKEKLLAAGYDVLMIRENDDVQLDNIARTVMANNMADCHIALHWDSTEKDKGTKLMDARDLIFKILQDRSLDMRLRMAEVLALAHDLQRRVRDNVLYQTDALFEKYNSSRRDGYFKEKLAGITGYSRYEVIKAIMDLLEKMEPLNHQWPEYRDELKVCLLGDGEAAYEEMRKAFFQSPEAEKMNLWTEQLMVYFVYTYFCGGVYNENPYGKMKAAIVSTIMIQDMMMVHWKKHGTLTLKEAADVAHRYSREIEHSDENKGLLEETLTREEEFRLRALLAAL